jgi:hypothetical protein
MSTECQPAIPPEPDPSIHALRIQILALQVDIVLAAAEKRKAELERDEALAKLKKYETT